MDLAPLGLGLFFVGLVGAGWSLWGEVDTKSSVVGNKVWKLGDSVLC